MKRASPFPQPDPKKLHVGNPLMIDGLLDPVEINESLRRKLIDKYCMEWSNLAIKLVPSLFSSSLSSLISHNLPSETKRMLELVLAEFTRIHKWVVREVLNQVMDLDETLHLRNAPFYAFCSLFSDVRPVSHGSNHPEPFILHTCKDIILERMAGKDSSEYFTKAGDPKVRQSPVQFRNQTMFLTGLLQSCKQPLLESFTDSLVRPFLVANLPKHPNEFIFASILLHSASFSMKFHYEAIKVLIFGTTNVDSITPDKRIGFLTSKKNQFYNEVLDLFFSSGKTDFKAQKTVIHKLCACLAPSKKKREADLPLMNTVSLF
jgi:hypothetical protein